MHSELKVALNSFISFRNNYSSLNYLVAKVKRIVNLQRISKARLLCIHSFLIRVIFRGVVKTALVCLALDDPFFI